MPCLEVPQDADSQRCRLSGCPGSPCRSRMSTAPRRRRLRDHTGEGLAASRAASPPRSPGRPHADDRRSSHHRSRWHPSCLPAMAEDANRGRNLRSQPLQGHPHPSQRSKGEEEAETDPRPQLRGDAPLRESGRPLRGKGPRLYRLRPEAGEVLPLRREDFDGETFQVRRTAHEGQILEERGPTTASPTPAASSRCRRPSPGRLKPRSTSTAPTASFSSRPLAAASGASAPSTATYGSQPKKPLA
jgi:hypothetical protein